MARAGCATVYRMAMTAAPLVPLDVAPLDLEDFTPEEQAEIQESLAGLAAGRSRLVPQGEVQRALEDLRRQQGG